MLRREKAALPTHKILLTRSGATRQDRAGITGVRADG
jgi:hypothetical protein